MRRGVAAGFVVLIAFAVSAAPASGAVTTYNVAVQDNKYVPDNIAIRAGDTVVWADQGSAPHSVTADDGSFDSNPACTPALSLTSCMRNGSTFRHTFPTSGRFAYHCRIHQSSGMVGVVTVLSASQPPPPTTTTRRTPTTRAGSTTTVAGGSTTTETLTPGGAVGIDNTSSSSDSTGSAAAKSGGSDSNSRAVVILVVALAAVAAGGGALLWRLRPRG